MNKKIIAVLFSVLVVVPAFAHAPWFDQFLEQMVSYRAMMITVLFVHIMLWVSVKLLHNKLPGYRRVLRKVVRFIKRKNVLVFPSSWILSSFVLGVYLILLSNQLFLLFSLIPFLLYILVFYALFLRKNWRKRFITGVRPMYCYMQSTIFVFVGLIIYYILSDYEWFRFMLSYTTEEYLLAGFYLYPQREVVYSVIEQLVLPLIINAFPYIIYAFACLCKYVYCKHWVNRTQKNQPS